MSSNRVYLDTSKDIEIQIVHTCAAAVFKIFHPLRST